MRRRLCVLFATLAVALSVLVPSASAHYYREWLDFENLGWCGPVHSGDIRYFEWGQAHCVHYDYMSHDHYYWYFFWY